jgi:hypothetical protein
MVQAAMEGTLTKTAVSAEAARQLAGPPDTPPAEEPPHYSTEYVSKLASALDFVAEQVKQADQGNVQAPGVGPGTLGVLPTTSSEKNIDAGEGGQATAGHVVPKNPATQKEEVQVGKANTGLQTNDDMSHDEQPKQPIQNEKTTLKNEFAKQTDPNTKQASFEGNLDRLSRIGEPAVEDVTGVPIGAIRKLAEDAIYPANVQGVKKENPPAASSAEKGKVPVPKDVRSQMRLVGSNQAAIDYNKGQAKADPKSDLGDVLTEPALSSKTDKVLQKTLDHTGEAGGKISMAQDVTRVNAARAYLSNLMAKVAAEKGGKKKEKTSTMAAAPSIPQQIPTPIQ